MRKQFQKQIESLGLELVTMGSMTEEAVHDAIKAVRNQDQQLATGVISKDDRLDEYEERIEQRSISLIALQQPVARDLRRINAIAKIASNLERIGDLALNIAYISKELILSHPHYSFPYRINQMSKLLQTNLRAVLSAFIEENSGGAKEVAVKDQKIDQLDHQIVNEMTKSMPQESIDLINHWLFVSRYLERMGDNITNICEWIIYIYQGKRVNY